MDAIGQVTLEWTGVVGFSGDWRLGPETHPIHEIVVIRRGRWGVLSGGASIFAGPGDVLYYAAQTPHEEWAEGGRPVECYLARFYWCDPDRRLPCLVQDTLGRMETLVRWLIEEAYSSEPGSALAAQKMLEALLSELIRLAECPNPMLVQRVKAFIHFHIGEHFTLEDLARHCDLSKYHFARRFRQSTGMAPMGYARAVRVDAARQLLLTTHQPLKTIATRVGLADERNLARLLRDHFGRTPRELRADRHSPPFKDASDRP